MCVCERETHRAQKIQESMQEDRQDEGGRARERKRERKRSQWCLKENRLSDGVISHQWGGLADVFRKSGLCPHILPINPLGE